HSQDCGLDGIETAVPAQLFMDITARAPVIAQAAHARRHFRIIGGHHASVAVSAEVLRGIKTERRGDSHCSCAPSSAAIAPSGANSLRRIFNHRQMEFVRETLE